MKQILKPTLLAGLVALSSPGLAETGQPQSPQPSPPLSPEGDPKLEDGAEMMSRGLQMLLDGLAQEMSPMRDGLAEGMAENWARQLHEGWQDLMAEMGDLSAYHPPEVLPNGDIILRRKLPQPPVPPEAATPDGGTDL
ncbi:hypothetical protein K3X48_03245 [Aliiroseovarius crassostreae]|uniref:AAA+ family ATPase n=1 Tax=Aliiroseovarius crassostreae TaxID=154981 RepID=A0A9Q9HEB0_9RHOB|nr:hypothetical protein [Aliiroseovarius crassostreae]UWP97032.1 hypothetical protein K3X48_03245 [Aliiroseovarius crassostreae]